LPADFGGAEGVEMNAPKTVTITGMAWATGGNDIEAIMNGKDTPAMLADVKQDMTEYGWTKLGPATMTFEVPDRAEVVKSQVAAIDAQITELDGKYSAARTELIGRKNNLLALTMESEHGD
jgi:hypothetical protein